MRSINIWILSKIVKSPNNKVAFLYFDVEWELEFEAGQFVVLDMQIDGKSVKRSYSIATTPWYLKTHHQIWIIVKSIENGLMSNALLDMNIWDKLTIIWPAWHMYLCEDNIADDVNYVLISTWSGLSPIYSILQTLIEVNKYDHIINIFGERSDDFIIQETISCLTMSDNNISSYIALSRQVWSTLYNFENGYVQLCLDKEINKIRERKNTTKWYICGQPNMVDQVYDKLVNDNNIPKEDILFEKY